MRKYKLIALVVVVAITLTSAGVYAVVKNRQQVNAREASVAEQERVKQLSEWQEKIKMWDQQAQTEAQTTTTAAQSDLEQQGVAMLPDTGPGHVAAVFFLTTLFGSVSYFFITKYIFSRY